MALELTPGQMEQSTRASGRITKSRGRVFTTGLTGGGSMEGGKRINCMGAASTLGRMAAAMTANTLRTRSRDSGFTCGLTGRGGPRGGIGGCPYAEVGELC